MPSSYWYWAIRHTACVLNIFPPLQYDQTITTRYELVYRKQPDNCHLIKLFITTYFSHQKDGSKHRSPFQAQTLQGIAVGCSDIPNGLEIYNPLNKQFYTSTVFKIDNNITTKG